MADQHAKITLEILTPEKPFLTKEVVLVVVPSKEGDLGAMAQSAPLLCALRIGTICIFDERLLPTERYFVSSGTAWITGVKTVLLVPEVFDLKHTDDHTVQEEIKSLESRRKADDEESLTQLEVLRAKHYALQNLPYA